uniref:Carboxylesterase type B domain-containing protein n=1 Tax=Oreochromis niloticus TaxID=8128 RepID=A0A669B922_ORENI
WTLHLIYKSYFCLYFNATNTPTSLNCIYYNLIWYSSNSIPINIKRGKTHTKKLTETKTSYLLSYAGAPVYLYEYQHPPKLLQQKRPSFVGTVHGDEMFTVFGLCFTTTHVKLLSKIMMSYWGNFARTGSPDGHNLVHWPKYGAEEKYLHLKKERFVFLTQTVPEKIQQHEENAECSELLSHLFSLLYSFLK